MKILDDIMCDVYVESLNSKEEAEAYRLRFLGVKNKLDRLQDEIAKTLMDSNARLAANITLLDAKRAAAIIYANFVGGKPTGFLNRELRELFSD